jgi:hypothetical protein
MMAFFGAFDFYSASSGCSKSADEINGGRRDKDLLPTFWVGAAGGECQVFTIHDVPTAFCAIARGSGGGPEAQILYYVDHRIGDGSVKKENKELRSSRTESWDGKKEAFSVPCARRCVPAHVSWLELLSRLAGLMLEGEGG